MVETQAAPDWRHHGVKVIPGDQLDTNTPQTPGMNRAAAINFARAGAQKLWAGTVTIHANAKTGAHHHGELECVLVRSDQEAVVVNLDIPMAETVEEVRWEDPIHRPDHS